MEYSGERFLPENCKGEMEIEHYQRYQFAKEFVKNKIVLDAACGEGYGSSILGEAAQKVIGMDIDEEVVKNANEKYGSERVSYVEGSVDQLPFEDNSFDMIVSFETIEHVDDKSQELFLKEIMRVLKSDGVLIMSTPNKTIYTDLVKGENKFHIKEFYVEEYKQFLKTFFSNMTFYCQYPDTGYFITREDEAIVVENRKMELEKSRYVIAVCSNKEIDTEINLSSMSVFDDSMYYYLNLRAHELERLVINTKVTTDQFEKMQEHSIREQKEYITHLECDLKEQKEYITHLEKDMKEQKGYIDHLESDIKKQQKYIEHLEKDISELKQHLEKKY